MKFGVIVGHTEARPGAFSETLGSSEYPWNKDLARRIEHIDTALDIRTFFRDGVGIAGAYAAADDWGAHLTTELHFNSSHSPLSNGSGILYYPGSRNGRRFASLLFEEFDSRFGFGDWPRHSGGVVTPFQASGQQRRGQRSLEAGRAPATLIEPFFGSNPEECAVMAARKDDLATAILRAAERYAEG